MRFSHFLLLSVLSVPSFAQTNSLLQPNLVHTDSWYKSCYKIPADSAFTWLKKDAINFNYLDKLLPVAVLPDSIPDDSAKLGTGQYIWVKSRYDKLEAYWRQVSKLSTVIFEDGLNTKLLLYNNDNQAIANAAILVANKKIHYSEDAQAYILSTKKWKEDKTYWIKAASPTDTFFYTTEKEIKNRWYNNYQKKNKWKSFPIIRQAGGISMFFKRLFGNRHNYYHENMLRSKQKETGFALFSKPLYKPGDTVKLKAWITDRNEKPVVNQQSLWINYYANGSYKNFELARLPAAIPGSFSYSFALPDSFPNDTYYSLEFRGPKKYNRLNASFKMEEYQLPDISKFDFIVDSKEGLLTKDTLGLSFEANGTNGLPLLDASVNLIVLAGDVYHFYNDSLFVPDTLFQKNYPLITEGKTIVKLPASIFPKADMELKVIATLKNSSNETNTKTEAVQLYQHLRKVKFTKYQNRLQINYLEDGKSVAHTAMVNISGNIANIDTLLHLPATVTLHPLATECTIQVYNNNGKKLFKAYYDLSKENGKPIIEADNRGDSIGFVCNNPNSLPINYTITKNNKIIWQHQTDSASFSWYKKMDIKHMYHLHATYIFNGEPIDEDIRLAVYFKKMDVRLTQQPVVQPGAKDTLHIVVIDYKQQPVPFANLTASGQNTQLKEKFNFPPLPIIMNFKDRHKIPVPNNFKLNEPRLTGKAIAIGLPNLFKHIGLDSMQFYQWLSTTKPMLLQRFSITHLFPEISVKAIVQGQPEAIFITYINKQPIRCAWQNDCQPFSAQVYPGYVQVGIRIQKKYIQIDSVYMQPYYKHELFINIDSIGNMKNTIVTQMPDTLTSAEKYALEQRFIRVDPRNAGNIWLWQANMAAKLATTNGPIIVGPFNSYDSIHVYKESDYYFKFPFEAGFTYRFSKNLTRMEKTGLLPGNVFLAKTATFWHIGDTIPDIELPPPSIIYPSFHRWAALQLSTQPYSTSHSNGTLQLQTVSDSNFTFAVLIPDAYPRKGMVYTGSSTVFHNILPGKYKLVLVSSTYSATVENNIYIQKNGLTCYQIHPTEFSRSCPVLDSVLEEQLWPSLAASLPQTKVEQPLEKEQVPLIVAYGKSNIIGKVYDEKGKDPIVGASIRIKGALKAAATDAKGNFHLQNLTVGNYTLIISAVGYIQKTIQVKTIENDSITINAGLEVSTHSLSEVVVVGYGSIKKKDLTGSISTITSSNLDLALQGRVAGLDINGSPGANAKIQIRGIASIDSNKPLVVVDGVLMDEIPSGMDTSILKIEILRDASATSIYGAKAANGVIIISTGRNNGPAIRTKFKDDAYWVPNTATDKNGLANIPIQYPDNITNWQNIVYAAASKGRYGRAFSITKAFKAVQGLLTVPSFLSVNDSVQLVGKAMNFGASSQTLTTDFKQGAFKLQSSISLLPSNSSTQYLAILAPDKPDTLKAGFVVKDEKNYTDGEERTIPVFETGTLETKGQFFVLDGDTTLHFKPFFNGQSIQLYAENKLIDVLEKELENLKNYPQACMEQTANKLWGLIMMRQIKTAQHQPFVYEKIIAELINRLMKNQQLDGGWPWWPGGNSNLYITTKVLQALRQLASTETVQQSVRNGFIYLQNQLTNSNISNKLEALSALAEGQHIYPYQLALDSIHFDSLSIHQQWQWIRIKQKAGLSYSIELEKLLKKQQQTILGGIFWGTENWRWYSNRNASTVLAFRVLSGDSLHQSLLPHLKQFFLEQKKDGYYRNTVEQAEISALLLTSALEKNTDTSAAALTIADKTINQFPFKTQIGFSDEITISKKGKGLIYLGLSQQFQNKAPKKVDSLFDVNSIFILKNGDTLHGQSLQLPLATPVNMQVKVVVKKEAQFAEIEIPIPAGMAYAGKPQDNWYEHREYLKNKVVIFKENLSVGEYYFSIPLETRFSGRFALNPAKVQLMYFPMFYGREEMKEVGIRQSIR